MSSFEQNVMQALGELKERTETVQRKTETIFRVLQGDGESGTGVIQRLTMVEQGLGGQLKHCTDQHQALDKEAERQLQTLTAGKSNHAVFWSAIVGAVLGSLPSWLPFLLKGGHP